MGRIATRDFDAVQDAMEDFNKAIEDDPDPAVAYLFRGFLYFTLGDIETGVRDTDPPTIHMQRRTGDVRGVVAEEESKGRWLSRPQT
jgi:Tfp pilus assembly protein PilF